MRNIIWASLCSYHRYANEVKLSRTVGVVKSEISPTSFERMTKKYR